MDLCDVTVEANSSEMESEPAAGITLQCGFA